jgi:sulfate permease, SulP family
MVLASLLFVRQMSEVTNVGMITRELEDRDDEPDPGAAERREIPLGVEVFEIEGPFLFAVADRLKDTLAVIREPAKIFVLRIRRVPAIDATRMHALEELYEKCRRESTRLLLAGVHAQPLDALVRYGLLDRIGEETCSATSTTRSTPFAATEK